MVPNAQIKKLLKNKLRHKITGKGVDVLIISFEMGETRPCRVKDPLMKYFNRAKLVIVTATLLYHVVTKVVEVELAFVSDRL